MVEYSKNGLKGVQNAVFDNHELRKHLCNCIEEKIFTPFPKISEKVNRRKNKIYHIEADCCSCKLPNLYDNMIGCENCDNWFHNSCANINRTICDSLNFVCNFCQGIS